MKIALCFSGLIGGMSGKNQDGGDGKIEALKISSDSIKKHIIEKNDVDVFVHSWETKLQDLIINTYKPKSFLFQPQITFNTPKHLPDILRVQSHYSRWFGNEQVISLKKQYEKNNLFSYDAVMVLRFDSVWYSDIIFSNFDMNNIHLAKLILKNGKQFGWPELGPEVIDHFIFSGNDNMNEFYETIYNNLDDYTRPGECPTWNHISHHFLIVWHLRKLGLLDSVKFPFTHYNYKGNLNSPYDYTLVRHYEEVDKYRRENG